MKVTLRMASVSGEDLCPTEGDHRLPELQYWCYQEAQRKGHREAQIPGGRPLHAYASLLLRDSQSYSYIREQKIQSVRSAKHGSAQYLGTPTRRHHLGNAIVDGRALLLQAAGQTPGSSADPPCLCWCCYPVPCQLTLHPDARGPAAPNYHLRCAIILVAWQRRHQQRQRCRGMMLQ
jgi:hypothetical protein